MFAIVKTGGKQYKVAQNDQIKVEKLDAKEGEKVTLDNVLLISDDKGDATFGDPAVKGASVEAEVIKNYREKKLSSSKKKKTKFS